MEMVKFTGLVMDILGVIWTFFITLYLGLVEGRKDIHKFIMIHQTHHLNYQHTCSQWELLKYIAYNVKNKSKSILRDGNKNEFQMKCS